MEFEIKDNRENDVDPRFIPNPQLVKANNESKIFICTECGECCHIREKKNISEDEERSYLSYMYNNFGIFYLADLASITINVWPEEKEILEKEALKKNIDLNIRPKRAVYNQKTNSVIILDYFIDHDICPFFDKKTKLCGVYDSRPLICRSYPLLTPTTLGKCKYKKVDVRDYGSETEAVLKLDERVKKQKAIIADMISKGEILIKNDLTDIELQNILNNSKFSELRM